MIASPGVFPRESPMLLELSRRCCCVTSNGSSSAASARVLERIETPPGRCNVYICMQTCPLISTRILPIDTACLLDPPTDPKSFRNSDRSARKYPVTRDNSPTRCLTNLPLRLIRVIPSRFHPPLPSFRDILVVIPDRTFTARHPFD